MFGSWLLLFLSFCFLLLLLAYLWKTGGLSFFGEGGWGWEFPISNPPNRFRGWSDKRRAGDKGQRRRIECERERIIRGRMRAALCTHADWVTPSLTVASTIIDCSLSNVHTYSHTHTHWDACSNRCRRRPSKQRELRHTVHPVAPLFVFYVSVWLFLGRKNAVCLPEGFNNLLPFPRS